jgi:hypothetical protein
MKTIKITDETAVFLLELSERMKTQDNRSTASPYFFQVRQVGYCGECGGQNKMLENFFLTEDGYDQYVRLNGHNLEKPYHPYVSYAGNNPEIAKLYEAIHEVAGGVRASIIAREAGKVFEKHGIYFSKKAHDCYVSKEEYEN